MTTLKRQITLHYLSTPPYKKIHGESDYEQLKNLKDKLKTNATKMPSDLGGGGFGHLGLVLFLAEYANISTVPYIRQIHPGALHIPGNTSE